MGFSRFASAKGLAPASESPRPCESPPIRSAADHDSDTEARNLPSEPMKTFSAKAAEVTHEWFVIDATDKVLGRVASEVALRLRGKHKPIYTPHVDTGDFIVIVNADKIRVTGNKAQDKIYYRHSAYPGGIRGTDVKGRHGRWPGRA